MKTEVIDDPAAVASDDALSVRVVDHHHRVVFLGELDDRGRGARSPSIEKTPSVMISFFSIPLCSSSFSARASVFR